jgi:hypothetical protein
MAAILVYPVGGGIVICWIELTEDRCSRCDGITMLPIKSILFCANCGLIYEKDKKPIAGKYRIIIGNDGFREDIAKERPP